jgi:hypothetical protein
MEFSLNVKSLTEPLQLIEIKVSSLLSKLDSLVSIDQFLSTFSGLHENVLKLTKIIDEDIFDISSSNVEFIAHNMLSYKDFNSLSQSIFQYLDSRANKILEILHPTLTNNFSSLLSMEFSINRDFIGTLPHSKISQR